MQSAATKKTQGLSFNTIVLAIIALLVLIIIVLFVTGGAARFSGGFRSVEATDLESAKNQCRILCGKAQTSSQSESDFKNSPYCATSFTIDVDTSTPGLEPNLRCHGDQIGIDCSVTISAIESPVTSCKPGCTEVAGPPKTCTPPTACNLASGTAASASSCATIGCKLAGTNCAMLSATECEIKTTIQAVKTVTGDANC